MAQFDAAGGVQDAVHGGAGVVDFGAVEFGAEVREERVVRGGGLACSSMCSSVPVASGRRLMALANNPRTRLRASSWRLIFSRKICIRALSAR